MKILIASMSLLLIAAVGTFQVSAQAEKASDFYETQAHATYDEVLDSETPTIYYYYQSTCHFCNSVKSQIKDFAGIIDTTDNLDFKLVDMKLPENKDAWYDWESHEAKYGVDTPAELNPDYISDPAKMKTIDDIEITGTPTMIYVVDGKVEQYEVGIEVFNIMESVAKEYNIDYKFDRTKYGQDVKINVA